jgi:hypothetical protein
MRFFEFVENDPTDKLIVVLKNYIGRASSKGAGSQLNWNGLNKIFQTSGVELAADYETFKSIYDSNPVVQSLVKDFNQDGINLNVPGAPDDQEQSPQKSGETSQDQVDKMAASAAPQQLAAQA